MIDWDASNPSSWKLSTTVDANRGTHPATGITMREFVEVRTSALDMGYEVEDGEESAVWWESVLTPYHEAKVAVLESSQDQLDQLSTMLGQGYDEYLADSDDLEDAASRSQHVLNLLRGNDGTKNQD